MILSGINIEVCVCVLVRFRLHSWGNSLEEAFEQCAMAMFGYMTDTETVEPIDTIEVESEGKKLSVCSCVFVSVCRLERDTYLDNKGSI